jgi:hypothetical protein
VGAIGESDFIFESDGKQRKLDRGEILDQAQSFTATAKPAEAAKTAETAEPAAVEAPARSPDEL